MEVGYNKKLGNPKSKTAGHKCPVLVFRAKISSHTRESSLNSLGIQIVNKSLSDSLGLSRGMHTIKLA